jgi:hypothetical protein
MRGSLSFIISHIKICNEQGPVWRRCILFVEWPWVYLNCMIVLPALPDAEKNRMMHCITRNIVKLVVQSMGHAPSTAHPIPSVPMQLQFPYICKTRKCLSQQWCQLPKVKYVFVNASEWILLQYHYWCPDGKEFRLREECKVEINLYIYILYT